MIRNLIGLALRVVDTAVLVYCVLSFVMPDSEIYEKLGRLVNPVLDPIRRLIAKVCPALSRLSVDFSPVVLWLIIGVFTRIF